MFSVAAVFASPCTSSTRPCRSTTLPAGSAATATAGMAHNTSTATIFTSVARLQHEAGDVTIVPEEVLVRVVEGSLVRAHHREPLVDGPSELEREVVHVVAPPVARAVIDLALVAVGRKPVEPRR